MTKKARRRRWIAGTLVVLALVTVAVVIFQVVDWEEIIHAMERLDPVLTIVLMALLPLVGFSVGVVYVIAGAKFGLIGGGAVIVGITLVHLAGTHLIARTVLRKPMERFLTRRNFRLPDALKGDERPLAAMVALVPGPPYVLRNYALALSGMALRSYFWVCAGIYIVRSYVTLALGDLGTDISFKRAAILGGIYAVKLGICALLLRRVQKHYRERKAAGAGKAEG